MEDVNDNLNKKSPIVFAGVKYYDLVVNSMTMIQHRMVTGDFDEAILLSRSLYSMVRPYMSDDEAKRIGDVLLNIQRNLDSWHKLPDSVKRLSPIYFSCRDSLFLAQDTMYLAVKDILLKTSGDEKYDMDFFIKGSR